MTHFQVACSQKGESKMATLFNFNEYDFQKVLAPNILKKKEQSEWQEFYVHEFYEEQRSEVHSDRSQTSKTELFEKKLTAESSIIVRLSQENSNVTV